MTNVVTDGALSIGVAFRSVLSENLMCLDTYQMKLEFHEVNMTSHRCEGSLKANASIRYDKRFEFLEGDYGWWLRSILLDDFLEPCGLTQCFHQPISYCPFCGEKLDE
jgi:hypothetical protein